MRTTSTAAEMVLLGTLALLTAFPAAPARGADEINASWDAGSRWKGIVKSRSNRGWESTFDGDLIVAERDGGKFSGTWTVLNGRGEMEIEGKINGTKVVFSIMKIVKWDDPNPRNAPIPENLVGVTVTGRIRRLARTKETVVDVSYSWPSATDPTIVRRGQGTLVLQE